MRFVVVVLLASSSIALAQPVPPPAEPEAPPDEASSLTLRAGMGFGRYRESGAGWKWQSDLQPFALVGAELLLPLDRSRFVLQAQAGLGSEVHMEGSGNLMQENDFHQQIFEISPRYRRPINPVLFVELGYRFTMQRLFFTNIPMLGDARETVTLHALEGSVGWRRVNLDGSRRHVVFTLGLNRGFAENSRIEGEDFSAGGVSLDARAGKRWASGFGIEGQLAYRKQSASDPAAVTLDGMPVEAYWPANVTWQLLGVIGFAL
jgi:hypothetical protein